MYNYIIKRFYYCFVMSLFVSLLRSWNLLSWKKCCTNLFYLQTYIFKSALVGDLTMCLRIQKLLRISNSSRFLVIRSVLNLTIKNSLFDQKDKSLFSFFEKFKLHESLLISFNNWFPSKPKKFLLSNHLDGVNKHLIIFSVRDRCWQELARFIMEPAHEASFSPLICGSRKGLSIYYLQSRLSLQLNRSAFGFQKRILKLSFLNVFSCFFINSLLNRLFVNRGLKIVLFRFLLLYLFNVIFVLILF